MGLALKFVGKVMAAMLVVVVLLGILGAVILPKVSDAIVASVEDKTAEIEERLRSEIEIQIEEIEQQLDSVTEEVELRVVTQTDALEKQISAEIGAETRRVLDAIEQLTRD
jgi:type II secretory pathway pseudopilin PulG